jgi:hypothetical protein
MEERKDVPLKTGFTDEELVKLHSYNGKIISNVVCYLWQNMANPDETVELIDGVELRFTDETRLTFSSNESGEGLSARHYSLKAENELLQQEFEGKIKIFGLLASNTKMWEDVIGKKLIHVKITKEKDGTYLNDSVMLDIEEQPRTLAISPMDGLVIDYYEE